MALPDVRRAAEDFLAEYHPDLDIPIPIEEILEFDLEIEIRPIPGLIQVYSRHGILLSSGTVIVVDERDFEQYQTRLRFTLAHELGHILLHNEYIDQVPLDNVEQAWEQYNRINPEQLSDMELDACYFAGHILVPQQALDNELNQIRQRILNEKGIDIDRKGVKVRDAVSNVLANIFNVSPQVVRIRLEEEGLP